MPRRTRKQLVESVIGNEDLIQLERDEECRVLARELHQQWRANPPADASTAANGVITTAWGSDWAA